MNPRAGRVRYKVVAFAVAMAAITYLDRVSISTLAPAIMRDLRISRVQMGYIFTAFPISYALFEIPTAWWGERVGTRRVLARIVAWWSAFTAATGAVTSYPIMLAVRFLFGAGEAGAWPNAAKAFSRWIPAVELGRVQGMFFMSAHLTGGLAPGIVLILESYLGWRGVFPVLGAIGFLWTMAWYRWYRDDPSEHAQVQAPELALIVAGRRDGEGHDHKGAWKALSGNPSAWWLCLGLRLQQLWNLFSDYLAPGISRRTARISPGRAGVFRGTSPLIKRPGGSFRRLRHGFSFAPLRSADRPLLHGRRLLFPGRGLHRPGGDGSAAANGRDADRRGRCILHARLGGKLGGRDRYRRSACWRPERGHEHHRASRQYRQPAGAGLSGPVQLQLGRAALRDGGSIPVFLDLLGHGASGADRVGTPGTSGCRLT